MMGKQKQVEPKLFYHGVSLDRRLPQNHPLRKIDELVDFNFIRSKVDDLYGKCGNPSVDPAVILGKKYGKTTLGYKDHRSVDDKHGIVTATVTTSANVNDEKVLVQVIEEHQANTDTEVKTVAADKAYGIGENYEYLYEHNITPCIGHRIPNSNCDPAFNHDKFIYDKGCDCYICPAGKILKPVDFHKTKNSMIYRTDRKTCPQCRHFGVCTLSEKGRRIQRSIYKEYVEWADNCLTKYERKRLMSRRQYKAEGSFADAANNHGFKRMRFRGIEKAKIQNLMIAAIQNLRKLMRYTPSRSADSACNPALKMLLLAENSFNQAFSGLEKLFQPT